MHIGLRLDAEEEHAVLIAAIRVGDTMRQFRSADRTALGRYRRRDGCDRSKRRR
jgi:hypothetical protein